MYKFESGRWIKFTLQNITFIGVTMTSVDDQKLISCVNSFGQSFVYGFEKIAADCGSMSYLKVKMSEHELGLISHIRPQVMDCDMYREMMVKREIAQLMNAEKAKKAKKTRKTRKTSKKDSEDISLGAFQLDKIGEA